MPDTTRLAMDRCRVHWDSGCKKCPAYHLCSMDLDITDREVMSDWYARFNAFWEDFAGGKSGRVKKGNTKAKTNKNADGL